MATADFKHLEVSMVKEVAVVEIVSKDLRGPDLALELGAELTTVAGQEWAKQLLLNFRHVRFLSSTGFAVLAKLLNDAKATGQEVKLCELDPDVRIGADIIGLSKYVDIHDHESAALKAFKD
ncbi:STAS domain-containing protein [Singulisphaera acidiphila]|uniref:Anti-anti-sigma regulatory factor (Antagonist of anti-sigma factor) n=1 Tax=Singulisphaera acidiphila (strain ATCC BAA-1392 / DSM 18658 / VKM B-2454 / MOB10) TaxID=886293 RepID=L0DQ85_SINAD|nr:STAS domain-containing protein [Singulisphaera acidiphila]AGA31005.1 anti-anti-sigma regulatory factor (antagonist of anti-sigma factor) [Singulisphaera acidiphila DSM 18658]